MVVPEVMVPMPRGMSDCERYAESVVTFTVEIPPRNGKQECLGTVLDAHSGLARDCAFYPHLPLKNREPDVFASIYGTEYGCNLTFVH